MKNGFKKLMAMALTVVIVLTVMPEINVKAASKVTLNKTKVTLFTGETVKLSVKNSTEKVTWKSSDKKVATVNSHGKVKAIKKGKATITAKVGGKTLKCKITALKDEEITVITLSSDIETLAKYYEEKTGRRVNVKVVSYLYMDSYYSSDLLEKKDDSTDVISFEPDVYTNMDAALANLNKLGAKKYKGKMFDYAWKMGQDSKGVQRYLPYEIYPNAFYYRRDIAKKVFGTDDPKKIGEMFSSYSKIADTADKLSKAGYKIFGSTQELEYFADRTPWVKNGTLQVSDSRKEYTKLCAKLNNEKYLSYSVQWSAPWYEGMAGKTTQLSFDTMWGDDNLNVWERDKFDEATKNYSKAEIFAYGLPTWGSSIIESSSGDTYGKWGICAGHNAKYQEGTCLGINRYSKKKEAAWEFIRFCTLNTKTAEWWIKEAKTNIPPALKEVVKKHKNDKNKMFGGQKTFDFWYKQAKKIKYQKPSKYDSEINNLWETDLATYLSGESDFKTSLDYFYSSVKHTYPKLKIKK